MIRTLLTIVFSLVVMLTMSGLSSWANEGAGQHDADEDKTINILGNTVGEESNKLKIQCPVMKTWFVPNEKSDKVVYKDKTYYFCCPGCKPQFDKDPEKYLKG